MRRASKQASERESGPISLQASWNQISRTKGTDDNDDADYNDRGSEWEEWWKKNEKWKLKGVENKWEENWASNEEEDRMCLCVCVLQPRDWWWNIHVRFFWIHATDSSHRVLASPARAFNQQQKNQQQQAALEESDISIA